MKYLHNKQGSSSIMLLVIITVILCIMSLTVDAGLLYMEKGRLQNTLDAAALAAVSAYQEGEERMLEEAVKYAELNGVASEDLSIDISENRRRVTVAVSKSVKLYFARIFSLSDADIQARATAVTGPISATNGIRPFAVEQQEFAYGETYTLKEGGGDGTTGNYGALSLEGGGAKAYKGFLINGYNSSTPLGIGDEVETEPGNMSGPTSDGIQTLLDSDTNDHGEDLSQLEPNCPRLIKIPVVDSMDVEGRSFVTIVGFAAFFLDDLVKNGGHTEIRGRFVKCLTEGEIDENGVGYGLFGIKLVE